jgi:hypothetical protein
MSTACQKEWLRSVQLVLHVNLGVGLLAGSFAAHATEAYAQPVWLTTTFNIFQ